MGSEPENRDPRDYNHMVRSKQVARILKAQRCRQVVDALDMLMCCYTAMAQVPRTSLNQMSGTKMGLVEI